MTIRQDTLMLKADTILFKKRKHDKIEMIMTKDMNFVNILYQHQCQLAELVECLFRKLDGVGPVDNRPSTD